MNWLLITNRCCNPGDIWARLGVEEIIRQLDPKPRFILRDRDVNLQNPNEGLTEPSRKLKFDYSVICGMPLVWSHKEKNGVISSTTQHESWSALTGWLTPEKMIVAGFGMFLLCPEGVGKFQMENRDQLVPKIQKFFDQCKMVYGRTPLVRELFPHVSALPCPSVLLVKPAEKRDLKLCNFMPGGGHYPQLAPEASKAMKAQMRPLSKQLIDAGFHFVAHKARERALAIRLGWPEDRIFCWMPDGAGDRLLDLYSRCSKYLGNRVHGGIVSRAAGADVVVLGYDTRLAAVSYVGGQTYTPLTMPDLSSWIAAEPKHVPFQSEMVRKAHVTWWSTNLRLPIIG